MHEGGHALYEHNVDPALERTPLCRGVSLALHESQSRMFENLVGRSIQFWRWGYPHVQRLFPAQFAGVELDDFHRAINRVQPSLIRIEADEATYSLHIILRFELEQELLAGARSTSASCPRSGTSGWASTSASRCRTTGTAFSRTSTGRAGRSATSPPTRSGT